MRSPLLTSMYKRAANIAVGFSSAIAMMVMIGAAFPSVALAANPQPVVCAPAQIIGNEAAAGAQSGNPASLITIGGTASGGGIPQQPQTTTENRNTVASTCNAYKAQENLLLDILNSMRTALVLGIMKGMERFTQTIAMQTGEWIGKGAPGQGPMWWTKGFGQFLLDSGESVVDGMIEGLDEEMLNQKLGFSFCGKPVMQFKLLIGLGRIKIQPAKCTLQKMIQNFDEIKNSLSSDETMQSLKNMVARGDSNDLSLSTSISWMKLNEKASAREAAMLDRQETGGLKNVRETIDGKITMPTEAVKTKLREEHPSALAKDKQKTFAQLTGLAALQAGVQELPRLFAMTFINTLANTLLDQFFAWLSAGNEPDIDHKTLDNELATPGVDGPGIGPDFSQDLASGVEPQVIAGAESMGVPNAGGRGGSSITSALSDILTANVFTSEEQNLLLEMSVCLEPRGMWGCTIDEGFVDGLMQRTKLGAATVARATGLGGGTQGIKPFLHLDWQLIPDSDAKNNQDKGCYQRAYCSANLAKLRFARILPIGWELAANSPYNTLKNGNYVTLGTVLRAYNSCNAQGLADADHPWCKLINPAWVLVAPSIQCNVKGYGSSVLDPSVPSRIQECSELVSCLQTDDKGKCIGGYGACLSDKTVWRFGGTVCEEKNVSCRAYKTRLGQEASYIRDTIDYGSCNSTNVGCQVYATMHDVSVASSGLWVNTVAPAVVAAGTPGYVADSAFTFTGPRIYLDATAESCSGADDGCTKLLKLRDGESALNLVKNSSFEGTDVLSDSGLDAWKNDLAGMNEVNAGSRFVFAPVEGARTIVGAISLQGSKSAYFWDRTIDVSTYQLVDMQAMRNYTVSYFARRIDKTGDAETSVDVRLLQTKNDVNAYVNAPGTFYRSINCTADASQPAMSGAQFKVPASISAGTLSDDWQRYTCEFVSNPGTVQGRIKLSAHNAAIDGVMLEESPYATSYVDGVNAALPVIHAKIAPEEYACTGDETKDRAECKKFARVCQQADMGCNGYTEASGVSPVEIPAKLTAADYCPSSCSGYADYRKLPSTFDLINTGAADPALDPLDDPSDDTVATFVPTRAEACVAEDVGCEEFTSLEVSAGGGESKAYYSYGRACRKPTDPNSAADTYFTWEGSDTTGYQLKTWALLKSDQQATSPVTPKILRKAGPDGVVKDPAACTAEAWKNGADLDCRQFYDSLGKAYYVYFSQTIVSTAACVDYRKNGSSGDDCVKTGGDFEQGTGNCIYHILPAQSNSCTKEAAGCRAYIGTGGRNSSTVLRDTFTQQGASFSSADGTSKATLSNESLLVGDKSLKVENVNGSGVGTIKANVTSSINTFYTISFWLKTTDTTPPPGQVIVNGKSVGTFQMPVEWQRVELGPFRGERSPTMDVQIVVPHVTYLDEVQVTSLQDTYFVKKGSWVVPAECDVTPEGVPQPKAMLGCREYKDRNGESSFAYRFTRLCRAESIGCTGFVDTRNSESPYAESFEMKGVKQYDPASPNFKPWDSQYTGSVTTVRPADRYIYVIDEPSARCNGSAASCRAFGKVEFDAFGKPATNTTVYLKDEIKKYMDASDEPNMLCRPSELFCESYSSQLDGGQQITSYFRNPNKHVCVWKERVQLADNLPYYSKGQYDGWFVAGLTPSVPCYPEKLSKGSVFLTEYTGSKNYRGWTNACPRDQGECTMFQDPNDKTNLEYPEGKPYFFVNNARIDKKSCAGNVDPLSGCVLLRDSTQTMLTFSSVASYAKSRKEGDNPVPPIDCSLPGQQDPTCVAGAINDANTIVRVKLDRDCATWLGCQSGETVFDNVQGKYVDICSKYAVCDKAGSANSQYCSNFIDRRPIGEANVSSGYQEPVLRQGRVVNQNAYAKRTLGFTDPDYSGYTQPNSFQLVDLVTRPVGYDILSRFPESVREQFARDARLVAAVPIIGNPFPEAAGAVPTDPKQYGSLRFELTKEVPSKPACAPQDINCLIRQMDIAGLAGVTTKSAAIVGKIQKQSGVAFVNPVTSAPPKGQPEYYAEYLQPDPLYPYLNLCRHVQTGLVGYFLTTDNPRVCYFSIVKPPSGVAADEFSTSDIHLRNAQNAANIFRQLKDADVKIDPTLSQAYPPVECKAYPAADSPFPNHFVQNWDASGKPTEFAPGYDGVPYCEKGQNCDCTYRKATYGGTTKYYSPFGAAPLGVCTGGSNEGVPCSPYQTDTEKQLNPICGQGGTCTALNKSTLVQGLLGQCLQRDLSRTIAGSQNFNPCLAWNPLPALNGPADVHHYSFSSGYMQMPTSGEYYCVSNMSVPKERKIQRDWFTPAFPIPALQNLYSNKAAFDTCAFLPKQTEILDKQQWIVTGSDKSNELNKSYREYFITFDKDAWAKTITNKDDAISVLSTLETKNFSQFKFDIETPSSTCGVPMLDKDKKVNLSDFDGGKNYIDVIDMKLFTDEDTGEPVKIPCRYAKNNIHGDCFYKFADMGYKSEGQEVFRMMDDANGGVRPFIQGSDPQFQPPYLMKTARSSKPYFAIRAMFENASDLENEVSPFAVSANGRELNGPWRFVGFWITASQGGLPDGLHGLLLSLSVLNSPICSEVAQVISPTNRDSVAFMDRVWKNAKYKLPVLGYSYGEASSPFGSAPNSMPIGKDPLFHSAVDLVSRTDVGNRNVFPGGPYRAFANDSDQPAQNWGWLTDLFARVYRVYRFYDVPVTKTSWACVSGPRFGSWCPNLTEQYDVPREQDVYFENKDNALPLSVSEEGLQESRKFCGYDGTCEPFTSSEVTKAQPRCNALSGVNSGLPCGGSGDEITGYHVCHQAPVKRIQGNLVPLYTSCELMNKRCSENSAIACNSDADCANRGAGKCDIYLPIKGGKFQDATGKRFNEAELSAKGKLRCASDAVKYPNGQSAFCTGIRSMSKECPREVIGGPDGDSECVNNHCTGGYEQASCNTNKDCSFTWFEWWNNGKDAPKPYCDGSNDPVLCPVQGQGSMLRNSAQIHPTIVNSNGIVQGDPVSTAPHTAELDLDPNYLRSSIVAGQPATEVIGTASNVNWPFMNRKLNTPYLGLPDKMTDGVTPRYQWWAQTAGVTTVPATDAFNNKNEDSVMNKDISGASVGLGGSDGKGRYAVLYDTSSFLKRFPGAYTTLPLEYTAPVIVGPVNAQWNGDLPSANLSASLELRQGPIIGGCSNDGQCHAINMGRCVANVCTACAATSDCGTGQICSGGKCNADPGAIKGVPKGLGVYIPGHCERPPVTDNTKKNLPYEQSRHVLKKVTTPAVKSQWKPWTPGSCVGGAYDGKTCVEDLECSPANISLEEKARAGLFCQPVTGLDGKPRNVKFYVGTPSNEYIFNCLNPAGDAKSDDPDTDDNLCTHGIGYYPRADLCGGSQNKAECLLAMAHGDGSSADVRRNPLPTDVTNGLYSPTFLGSKFAVGKSNPLGDIDDRYVSYYVPKPPMIAAPDTARPCATPGKCPISQVNAFTFENQSEGLVTYGGGQVRASMKFYAWATDDQAPLKTVRVDWGDGTDQAIEDTNMKNRKPVCEKPKECQLIPGLACGSDSDCPPAGGKCVDVGFCTKRPNIRCSKNEDCTVGSSLVDTCAKRITFGNSKDACDESYFNFSHFYHCSQEDRAKMPVCGTQLRCSRDPNRNCDTASDCAPGDSCVANLAPSGGCFDEQRANCRYTPRAMVIDNWGWCSGECRLEVLQFGGSGGAGTTRMGDAYTANQSASNQGIANYMLFSNGGCYDGSKSSYNDGYNTPFAVGASTHSNEDGNIVIKRDLGGGSRRPELQSYQNACDPNLRGSHFRPWIVFQGALQLGVGR